MESAPKMPSPNGKEEDKKSAMEKLRKAGNVAATIASIGIAAASPVNKVAHAPEGTAPLTTEKQVVRPKDMDDQVLKDEIDSYRAKFEIQKDGEIKRVPGNKEE